VKSLALFGSIARDEAGPDSDIDILVEFGGAIGLLGFVRLQRLLADLLKSRIDLVTADALKPTVREHVLKEAVHAA
jgi:predicted nucleotidyltransferase